MENGVALALVALILSTTLALSIPTGSATEYIPQVKVGNWAKYSMVGGWDKVPANATVDMPQAVKDAKNTEWVQINVTEVYGTTVTVLVTTRFKNGTQKRNVNEGDVKTGSGNLSLQVIAGDLSKGDKVFDGEKAPKVERTMFEFHVGASREVNYANMTEYVPREEGQGTISVAWEFRWDKATGFLIGMSMVQVYETEDYKTLASILMEIKETDVWQVEEGSSSSFGAEWMVVAGIVIIAIALTAYFATRRRVKVRRKRLTRKMR